MSTTRYASIRNCAGNDWSPQAKGRLYHAQSFWQTHALVELYGYAEAKNWRDLEADAFRAVAAQPWSPYGPHGDYPCPPDLAARAVAPDWVTWQIGAVQERCAMGSWGRY